MMVVFSPEDHIDKIDRKYKDRSGRIYILIGIMLSADDWYWVMWPQSWPKTMPGVPVQLLSCVGAPEGHGFEEVAVAESSERLPHKK